jgi:Protein of unknown function (DUF3618)
MTDTRGADRYAPPGAGPTDEDLEHEVELTRRELADTVTQLSQRLNVKARVSDTKRRTTERARELARRHGTALAATGGAIVLTFLVVTLVRRR